MADKTVKITFEIDGLKESVSNIDDAKAALQQLETQAEKTETAAEGAADGFKELGDESKPVKVPSQYLMKQLVD